MDRLTLLLAPLAVGVAVGFARGGRLRHLAERRLRGLWWLWIAAGLQAAQFHVEPVRRLVQEAVGIPMRVLVYAIPLAWFARSAGRIPAALRRSAGVALAGMVCNALPIVLNGRMPYVGEAARLAGVPAERMTPAHPPADTDTVLVTLGDVIPVPGVHAVVSIGDLLLLAGIAASVAVLMLPPSAATTSLPGAEPAGKDQTIQGGKHGSLAASPGRPAHLGGGRPRRALLRRRGSDHVRNLIRRVAGNQSWSTVMSCGAGRSWGPAGRAGPHQRPLRPGSRRPCGA